MNFWERGHSDDLLFMMLVVINAAVTQIKSVSEVRHQTFKRERDLNCILRLLEEESEAVLQCMAPM